VEVNNRIATYVIYEYVGLINDEFGYWHISLLFFVKIGEKNICFLYNILTDAGSHTRHLE
jgi:hypothetical protein